MKQSLFKANITAVGKYLPKKVITNQDMEKLVETSDEWIQSRTGIRERRKVQKGEATVEMSTNAVHNLLNKTLVVIFAIINFKTVCFFSI